MMNFSINRRSIYSDKSIETRLAAPTEYRQKNAAGDSPSRTILLAPSRWINVDPAIAGVVVE
ncbi:MAG: hypothetical protein HS132_16925 [Planctomycetia bacterium]|nr:hypothetical protein [Planctomycetia bacterium]